VKIKAVIDRGIGETRCAVYEGRRLVEMYVRRWSQNNRPRLGDIYAGRITAIDQSVGGAFVDLGFGKHGLLKFTQAPGAPRFNEGMMVKAEITREALSGKGPVVKYIDQTDLKKIQPLVQISLEDFLTRRFGKGLKIENAPVNHIEEAVLTEIALPGGGTIFVEPTRALVAIDVDKGGAQSGYDVAIAAIPVLSQQLRLRGLGGLIAIDFPNLRQNKQKEQLILSLQDAFENDPNTIKIAPLSRFGVTEMTRAIKTRPLDDLFKDKTETNAMLALRRLEREAVANPGAQLELNVPHYVFPWLDEDAIGWRQAMTDKIGARFNLVKAAQFSIKSDR